MKQSVVDRCVDDLAYTFGVSRSQLNVVRHHSAVPQDSVNFQTAAAKGLVAGNLTIRREEGTVLHLLNEKEV
jgi:meiotic recombination protein SPO11